MAPTLTRCADRFPIHKLDECFLLLLFGIWDRKNIETYRLVDRCALIAPVVARGMIDPTHFNH